jgi:hypothetical protein
MMTKREIRICKINLIRAGRGRMSSQRPITKIRVAPSRRIFILGRNTPFNNKEAQKAR